MLKAYKYRIYPNKEQSGLIEKTFGCCRFVYNLALETKIEVYRRGISLSRFDLINQLSGLKEECMWLKEVNAQSLQCSINKIDVAYRAFFNGRGFPNFKRKNERQSFSCPQKCKVNFQTNRITIPKIKNIAASISRRFEGKIKTVTISKTPTGKYFASVLVETPEIVPNKPETTPNATIGIDLGLKYFLITSEGIKIENPRHLKNNIAHLKVLQRRASKKKKGSTNRKKANLKVVLQHEKITNQRKDFLQKLSTQLVRDSQATTFCIETLAVKNMVKNHKLAQAISDVSWSSFTSMLQYKCDWYGKNLIRIDRFEPSSKRCSECGEINQELTLAIREWQCNNCNVTHDRDINAAINIKFMGLSGLGKPVVPVEQRTVVRAKKQELSLKIEANL